MYGSRGAAHPPKTAASADSAATLPAPPSKTTSSESIGSAGSGSGRPPRAPADRAQTANGVAPRPSRAHAEAESPRRSGERSTDVAARVPPPLPGRDSLQGSLANLNISSAALLEEEDDEEYDDDMKTIDPSARTLRKCAALEVYMYDQYMNLYTFLGDRKKRTARFKEQMHGMGFAEMSVEYKARWNRFLEKEGAAMRERRTRTKAVDFVILSQIGQGGYGSVFLAKKKATEEVVALKKMSKTLLHRLGEVDHILTERDILTQSRSPWLVKLLYSFQDTENVYLAMEYVPGGDIRTLLNVNPGPIAESHCRFYLAEMALGVNALHEMGYIHRDLKPENFLIDTRGHVKLTDFGLAKGRISYSRIESMKLRLGRAQADVVARSFKENQVLRNENRRREVRATSLVGSPDYMAPEILNTPAGGYDKLVDYWSLGTILFEFLVGYPPFQGANADEVWNNVLQWTKILVRPTEVLISDNAWSMITALIAHKPNRLSSINALQCHPFMKPLAFGLLGTSAGPRPPFVPDLADAFDTRHFDDFTDPASMAIYAEVHEKRAETEQQASKAGKGAGEEEARGIRRGFVGFTFRRNDGEKLAREAGLRRQGSTSRDLLFDA